jgi:hypothetical protein
VEGVGDGEVSGRPSPEATEVGDEESQAPVVAGRMVEVKAMCVYALELKEGDGEPAMVGMLAGAGYVGKEGSDIGVVGGDGSVEVMG